MPRPLPLAAAALFLLPLGSPLLPTAPAGPLPSPGDGARPAAQADTSDVTQGALRVTRGDTVVECPLRHTAVRAEVSGFIARVRVTQTFENPYDEAIEAVYVFPLPHGSAVDEMTMAVGERRIAGVVKRRPEARAIYDQALAQGRTAALLEQERPNIFTQSVGNIPPRQQVRVEIAYVDVLPYESGRYEFHFPMVVGPRYIPGAPGGRSGGGWSPDTTRVPDASRITPPVLRPGLRTGHDVSLTLALDAGVPVRALKVHSHEAEVRRSGPARATVTLAPGDSIPNKDFVLSYHVAGERPQTAVLSHAAPGDDGYFLLMVQPHGLDDAMRASPPRDVCFLIDVSGSMSGQPIAKVAEAMERFFARMRPQDRLQVVTFSGSAAPLFPRYLPATRETIRQALDLTRRMQGGGGTDMLQGIRAVLADPVERDRVRIVVMLTDGYIGNEDEIIGEVGRRAGDQVRFWTVGIGSSPNRHLLEGVARQGSGASAVLGLQDDVAPLAGSVMDRIQRAQLSRLHVDWGGLDVFETYPARLGELWAGKPVFLLGRYRGQGEARLTVSGLAEGDPVSFEVPVTLAGASPAAEHAVLAPAWARRKIEHLTDQMAVLGESEDLVAEVTQIALSYRLMSAYTSFVAVDESEAASAAADPPLRMMVPVPMPDGVSYEGVFGRDQGLEVKEEIEAFDAVRQGRPATRPTGMAYKRHDAAPASSEAGALGLRGVAGGVVASMPVEALSLQAAAPPPAAKLQYAHEPAGRRAWAAALPERTALMETVRAARDEADRRMKAGEADGAAEALMAAAAELGGRGGIDAGALAADLAAASEAREKAATRSLPALGRPLSLVLRNMEVATALERAAVAIGAPLEIAPGALDEAARVHGRRARRIGYLDLRGLTGARALTWISQPAGLVWRLESGRLLVRVPRPLPGPASDGTARSDGDAPGGAHETARDRAAIAAWSWRLAAAGLEERVDDEAASELLEALSAPGAAARDALTMRALWATALARKAVPSDATIARLWQTALAAVSAGGAGAPRLADEAALYALVLPPPALAETGLATTVPAAPAYRDVARALAALPGEEEPATAVLAALSSRALRGDDALVLSGAALRLHGGEPWARFRAEAAALARTAGASPGALRVVNRLDAWRTASSGSGGSGASTRRSTR